MLNKKIVFSGVQPSGNLHIGNYLGAIAQWVEMQAKYNCIFCVVDYHAITIKQDPEVLKKKIIEVAKIYLASGIDPKKSIIFQQSDISAHTELTWILNCVARISDLNRMTQFKEKASINLDSLEAELNAMKNSEWMKSLVKQLSPIIRDRYEKEEDLIRKVYDRCISSIYNELEEYKNNQENVNVGLFDYPVLMAADILLYNTDAVPVGEDQAQHVELCRTLGRRFNSQFGEVFKIPEVVIRKEGARIMGLDDPAKKMSKSAESEYNFIGLTDKPEAAAKKIRKAVTDSGKEIKYDEKTKPAISNLLTIYSLLVGKSVKQLESKYKGKGYGDFKKDLAEMVKKFLTDFQARYKKISDKEVEKILENGAKKVKPIADETLERVKEKIGIN